jgi:hypothetical protein
MPDPSVNIANTDNWIIRQFAFTTCGRNRLLTVAHQKCVWYVKLDGELVASKKHSNSAFKNWSTSVDIDIPSVQDLQDLQDLQDRQDLQDASTLIGTLRMEWVPRQLRWNYTLLVGSEDVSASWKKGKGATIGHEIPEVAYPQAEAPLRWGAV